MQVSGVGIMKGPELGGGTGGDQKHWSPCFHLSDEGIAIGGLSFIIVNEEQIKAFEGRGQVNDICETCSLGGAFLLGPEPSVHLSLSLMKTDPSVSHDTTLS